MDQNKNTPQETYSQPDGIFSGKPDIAYPNTPGFTPKDYVPVGGIFKWQPKAFGRSNSR